MHFNSKAMPTNDADYSCHIIAVEFVNQSYGVHIMPLIINILRGGHMHMLAYRRLHRNNFKNPGERMVHAGSKIFRHFACFTNSEGKVLETI